jgi:hypothetical protein
VVNRSRSTLTAARAKRALPLTTVLLLAGAILSCRGKSANEMRSEAPGPLSAPQPGAPTSCPVLTGEYRASFKTSCGSTGWGWVKIEQNGCDIDANLTLLGRMKGTLRGDSAPIAITFNKPCSGSGSGTLTASGKVVAGTFAGSATGADQRCCNPISGTFSFTKQ